MKKVVIIGGSVIDLFLYPHDQMIVHDSNPGYMRRAFGGVGRNIAENLVRLGVDTTLITTLGVDPWGKEIFEHARDLGMCLNVIDVRETPLYISVIDETGEDFISVALMDEIKHLDSDALKMRMDAIKPADILVLDTNLSHETLKYIMENIDKPIYVDTISSQKAIRIKPFLERIHTLKMNLLEAEALSGIKYHHPQDLEQISTYFIEKGVKEVFITLGKDGAYYRNQEFVKIHPPLQATIKNSTGAGDAFFAGIIYGKIHGLDPLLTGLANAKLNLESHEAVSQQLTKHVLDEVIKENMK